MFQEMDEFDDLCSDCVPLTPIELHERLESQEFHVAMQEFFNGPAQELITQLQSALVRVKSNYTQELKTEVGQ